MRQTTIRNPSPLRPAKVMLERHDQGFDLLLYTVLKASESSNRQPETRVHSASGPLTGVIEPDRALPDVTRYHTIITSSVMSASSLSCPNIARLDHDCSRPGATWPDSFSPDNSSNIKPSIARSLPTIDSTLQVYSDSARARPRRPEKGQEQTLPDVTHFPTITSNNVKSSIISSQPCARARSNSAYVTTRKRSRTDATRRDSFSHNNKQQRQVIDHLFSTTDSARAPAPPILHARRPLSIPIDVFDQDQALSEFT